MTKAECAKQLIKELEVYKSGHVRWADDIDIRTKNRVIEVCQNVIYSWAYWRNKKHD